MSVLSVVGILILIHHYVFKLILIAFKYFGVALKKLNRVINNIIKIHGICRLESFLIFLICLCNFKTSYILAAGVSVFQR